MSSPRQTAPEQSSVLEYLLKHAQRSLSRMTNAAFAPLGIDSREYGILRLIAGHELSSQNDIAKLAGVDRTTIVALIDAMERKGLVSRQPLEGDRRRNIVLLTNQGQVVLARAEVANSEAEQQFLAGISPEAALALRFGLEHLITE